jgi:hypothetical protein
MLNDASAPLRSRKESVYTRDARNIVPQRSLETCKGGTDMILIRDYYLLGSR